MKYLPYGPFTWFYCQFWAGHHSSQDPTTEEFDFWICDRCGEQFNFGVPGGLSSEEPEDRDHLFEREESGMP